MQLTKEKASNQVIHAVKESANAEEMALALDLFWHNPKTAEFASEVMAISNKDLCNPADGRKADSV